MIRLQVLLCVTGIPRQYTVGVEVKLHVFSVLELDGENGPFHCLATFIHDGLYSQSSHCAEKKNLN